MSRFVGQKSTKKRSKLEKLLRQDHSDVYFDNDRLNDQLSLQIDELTREKYRKDLERELEVGKLRKEIHELNLLKLGEEEEEPTHVKPGRPHTTGDTGRRRIGGGTSTGSQRVKSAWPKVTFSAEPPPRAPSPTWSESSLRNPKILRKYKNIGAQSFKENNKFPAEWYVRCLPSSDAAIYNSRRTIRGKSAPPVFTFLSMLRDKEETRRKIENYKRIKQNPVKQEVAFKDLVGDSEEAEKMGLVCEQPVKPIVMSRRKLMEITNIENITDRGPSRNTVRKQSLKKLNEDNYEKIKGRIQEFCAGLVELKKRQAMEEKEREERKRRERQEEEYLESISIAHIIAPPVAEPDSDSDSDTPRFMRLRPRRR